MRGSSAMEKGALEALLSADRSAIAWSACVVAVGLIGEYWKQFVELLSMYWNGYPINLEMFSSIAKKAFATLVFPAFVVAGVTAEWLYEVDSSIKEGQYAKLLDNENTTLTDA